MNDQYLYRLTILENNTQGHEQDFAQIRRALFVIENTLRDINMRLLTLENNSQTFLPIQPKVSIKE